MANATPSRLGEKNAAGGDQYELFLKVFAQEVIAAFAVNNVMFNGPMHMVRTIQSGKSASFPAHWKASSEYHTPGNEINGAAIKKNERLINIDNLLISHVFLASIDEAMNHYDVRSDYTFQLGHALATDADKNLIQLVALAARAATTVEDGDGGSTLTNADYDTTPDALVQGVMDAGQILDEKNVPNDGSRFCIVKPKHYNLLVQSSKAINRDFGGSGSIASGKVLEIDSIKIVKSNNLPSSNLSQVTGTQNIYHGNFSNTVGVVSHKTAVGTVKLKDLALESEYDIRRQGWLFVAKYAMGHGILRPEAAVELKKA